MITLRITVVRCTLGFATLLAALAVVSSASAQETGELRLRQAAQQRAQAMTRELVTGIFEVQLRQLSENGLSDTDLYIDIATMRDNVDLLVDEEMSEVIDLLTRAQQAEGDERRALTEEARSNAREIMVVLMAERQKLRRRLQISNIAAQVEVLIRMQTGLYDISVSLTDAELSVQETSALGTIEDQRDVKALYFELIETLNDVSGWGGDLGVGAQDGLRILRASAVENHLEDAIEQLELMQFAPASESQLAVLHGLGALMLQVQETQGLVKSNREAILESVRDLIARQTVLRDETSNTSLDNSNVNPLISEQNDIHQAIGNLDRQLDVFPGAPLLLEQAKSAAYEATGKLFDLEQSAAVAHQSEVIAALEQLTQRLESALNMGDEHSADELEEILEKIAQAREELEQATPFEEQALEAAEEDPLAAAEAQRQAAQEMQEAAQEELLPASAASRLREAAEAAEEAAEALEEAADNRDDVAAAEAALRALEDALDAHERAAAELAAQEADTQRRQLAVEVGELARAAEALERAAAAERRVADRSIEAAEAGGFEPNQLELLIQGHQQVTLVVEHVGAGVVNTAPAVAQMLAEAKQPLSEVESLLEQSAGSPPAATILPATQVTVQAEVAAQQLVEAAAMLRALAGESAEELAELATEQLQQVSEARREIEELVEEVRQPAADLANLQKALVAVLRAEEAQWRAMGRTEVAQLESLLVKIEEAVSLQGVADRSAAELAAGRANTPLEAIDRQQRSADHLAEVVSVAPEGPLRQVLARANAAAQQAARETLAGNNSQAAAARAETTAVLADALEQVRQAATAAYELPANEADAQAQEIVSQQAGEAHVAVGDAAPEAAEAIENARRSSQTAFQQINAGNVSAALPMQESSLEELGKAEKVLRQMLADASAAENAAMEEAGEKAGELAQEASQIDPDAADALRDAQRSTQPQSPQQSPQESPQESSEQSPQSQPTPQEQQEAREELADDLQRSAASMAAREEQIRRDKGVAEALAELAERQQEARDQIDESAQQLEDAAQERADKKAEAEANGQEPPSEEMTEEEKQAAEDLNQAMRDFAQAQKQTGQGAQEISQQENVENEELKKGLEAASQLPEAALPPEEEGEDKEKKPMDLPPPSLGGGEGDGNSPGIGAGSAPMGMGGSEMPEFDPDAEQPEGPPGSGVMPVPPGLPPGPLNPNEGAGGSQAGPPTDLEPPPESMASSSGEQTAEEIAGQDALEQALKAMQEASQSQSPSGGGGGGGTPPPPSDGDNASTDPPGDPKPSPPGASSGDSDIETLEGEEDPWFAELPPELQEEIHSGSQGRSPRGYEERLRRYHQSVE